MSVIQTIRNRYGKIAGGIIAVSLIAFIISDARNGSLFGNLFGSNDHSIMKVDGQQIDPKEYQECIKEYETIYLMQNGKSPDDELRAKLDEEAIHQLAYQTVVNKECAKIGLQTTDDEKKDLIYGNEAHPLIRQFSVNGNHIFLNPETNAFDPQRVKAYEQAFEKEPQKYDPDGKISEQLETVKRYIYRVSTVDKFNNLFIASAFTPLYEAQHKLASQNSMASIRYVKIPYTSVNDKDVKVTDDEIKQYMEKHRAQYEVENPVRNIEYVSFDIKPSSSDTSRALSALTQVKEEFTKAKDNEAMVNHNSDEPNYSDAYANKKMFPSVYFDTLLGLPVGSVYGPFYENNSQLMANNSYLLVKVVDKKELPDTVKCRFIQITTKFQGKDILSDSIAKIKIDSIALAIRNGANFDSLLKFTDFEESKKTNGEFTFPLPEKSYLNKEFGKEISKFIFEGKAGEKKVVRDSFDKYTGYRYVEVMEQKGMEPALQLAFISKSLYADDSTVNAIYGRANAFAGKYTTAQDFENGIKKEGLTKKVGEELKMDNFSITGLGPAREIVKWAYEHKVGEISPVFQLGQQRYVVAMLAGIQDKGLPAITAQNRPVLEQKVRNDKKSDIIINKYKGGATSLDALSKNTNTPVLQSDSISMEQSFIPNLGYEPKVVGYSFYQGLQPNTVSQGIKGQDGIYFITVLNRWSNAVDDKTQQTAMRQRAVMEMQMKKAIIQDLRETIGKMADIKYNTGNF